MGAAFGIAFMDGMQDLTVHDVHDIIGCVASFYEKGKSGNKKEIHVKEEKTKEVQTERR